VNEPRNHRQVDVALVWLKAAAILGIDTGRIRSDTDIQRRRLTETPLHSLIRKLAVTGKVLAVFTSADAQAPMETTAAAELEPGRGLVGDRYYRGIGTFSEKLKGKPDSEITLIESEEVERFNKAEGLGLGSGDLRRNIVTTGIRLNDLVGRRFQVGEVVLEGIRLCEPCAHLAKTVASQVLPGLVHRAGLRACIVSGGVVRTGDEIVVEPDE
jgi:MOSC domain-containing protein YiiM